MKKILFIILMLVSINTFGQKNSLEGLTFKFNDGKTKSSITIKREDHFKRNILFVINKWEIRPSEELKLEEIIYEYNYQKDTIHINGHADKATGTAKRNIFLSQKRAETVKDYLVKHGIDSTMIKVGYYGDAVNPFGTPELNRVEIFF